MDVKSLTFIFCCEVIAIIIKCACATVCVAQVFFVDRNKWSLPYPLSLVGEGDREAIILISWQMLQHLLFEEGAVEVGVYLRRINTLVSQHSLNGT